MRAGRWWMLGVTCLSVIVVNLDLTILNIALPAISAALHAGTGDLQWLVDAYSLVFAGVMLPAGMVGDRLGRKRLLLAGLAVFLAASLWCALSVSAGELIAARALMGLGAGIVFPLSLAVVSAAFGDDDRPTAIGILTAGVALALPLGPVLGGLLLQHFSWHSVFWINVPAACLTLAAGVVLMPESRNPAAPPLDVPGALLSTGAVVCLVWGFINGPEHGWTSAPTWGLLAGSAVLLAAFLAPRAERRAPARRPGAVPGPAVHLGHGRHRRRLGRAVRDLVRIPPVPAKRGRRRPDQRRAAAAPDDGRAAGRGRGGRHWSCGRRAPGSLSPPDWPSWPGGSSCSARSTWPRAIPSSRPGWHCAGSGPARPSLPRWTRSWPPQAATRPGSAPR